MPDTKPAQHPNMDLKPTPLPEEDHGIADDTTPDKYVRGKMTIGGLSLGDTLKATVKPIEPGQVDASQARPSHARPKIVSKVLFVIGIGLILFGLLTALLTVMVGVMFWVLGIIVAFAGLIIDRFGA